MKEDEDSENEAPGVEEQSETRPSPPGHGARDDMRPPSQERGAKEGQQATYALPRLNAERFRNKLAEMGKKAMGTDNWSVGELLRIPPDMWQDIAEMLSGIEDRMETR